MFKFTLGMALGVAIAPAIRPAIARKLTSILDEKRAEYGRQF